MGGRPKEPITPETQEAILTMMAEGMSLSDICRKPEMPGRTAVHALILSDKSFANKYARAAELRSEAVFDEMFSIADETSGDIIETESGAKLNAEHVQRARLRIDTRKWALSKMNPKKYGDRIEAVGPGPEGEHLHKVSADEAFAAFLAGMASLAPRAAGGTPSPDDVVSDGEAGSGSA